jgi:hypothetical protein
MHALTTMQCTSFFAQSRVHVVVWYGARMILPAGGLL